MSKVKPSTLKDRLQGAVDYKSGVWIFDTRAIIREFETLEDRIVKLETERAEIQEEMARQDRRIVTLQGDVRRRDLRVKRL